MTPSASSASPDGSLAVSGGRLVARPESPGGRPAVLDWEDGIVVRVDGVALESKPHTLRHGEVVEVEAVAEEPRATLYADISADGMTATLSVERRPGGRYRLEDQPANRTLTLRRLLVEREPCPPPSSGDLWRFLASQGIVHGIRADALERCRLGAVLREQIAWGTRPVDPVDAEVTLVGRPRDGQNADIWSVPAGSVIGHVRDLREGTPGKDVRGTVAPVRRARHSELGLGVGIDRSAAGELVAELDGFVEIVDGCVQVVAAVAHEGDIGESSGDVTVLGALDVSGGIRSDRTVRVRHSLTVAEPVERATVEVGGSAVLAKSVVGARLRVGLGKAPVNELLERLPRLALDLAAARGMIDQVAAAARTKGSELAAGRAAALVLDGPAADAVRVLKELSEQAEQHRGVVSPEVASGLRQGVRLLAGVRSGGVSSAGLAEAVTLISDAVDRLDELATEPVSLSVASLQTATAEVFGDLVFTGRGSVSSEIVATGDVTVPAPGCVRGGTLEFGGTALIAELGAPNGTGALVRLRAGARLEAALVHPGVTILTPDDTLRVSRLTENLVVDTTGSGAAAEAA